MPQPRILIIEDNLSLRRLYNKVLRRANVEIIEAESVAHAKKIIENQSFALVISDVELQDGETFHIIQQCSEAGTPVIAISAYENYRGKCIEAGAKHFLAKPFPTRHLSTLIETYAEQPPDD